MTTKMEKLSFRLAKIRQFVTGKRVADIGCDHGKLVADLFERKLIEYAFVSDISEPSVNKAVKLLSEKGYNFDFAVADGLDAIKEDFQIDEVVISGMGGLEIIKILSANRTNVKSFVLQPQNNELKLKKYLIKNKYKIVRDVIVKDKHMYYNVLKVVAGDKKQHLSEFELRFGKDNFNGNIDFEDYLKYLNTKYSSILANMPFLKKQKLKKELKYLNKAYKKLGENYENNFTISKS